MPASATPSRARRRSRSPSRRGRGRSGVDTVVLLALFASMVRATTPLLFAALGGLFSERSGVVNIALEGIMLFGAMAAAITAQLVESPLLAQRGVGGVPYAPWLGVLAGAVVGGIVGCVHAVISIRYRADQIISGTAINLMAVGIPAVVLSGLYANTSTSTPIRNRLPQWELFGVDNLAFSPLVYLAFVLVPVTWFVVYRTPFGLRLRAVGEHPAAADSLGVNVYRMRYLGVLAALGEGDRPAGALARAVAGLPAGRVCRALGARLRGEWARLGVLGAALLFGPFEATEVVLGGGSVLPPTIVQGLPYIPTN